MTPWKEDSTEDKGVSFYLKRADVIDLVYLSKLKKNIAIYHKTHNEQRGIVTQSQVPSCKEMWTLLVR